MSYLPLLLHPMTRTFLIAVTVTLMACGQTQQTAVDTPEPAPAAAAELSSEPITGEITDEMVQQVHNAAFLIDTHNDVPWSVVDGYDIGSASRAWHTDISRMKAGGIGAEFFAVYVARDFVEGNRSAHRTLEMIDAVRHDIVERYPDDFLLATNLAEVEEARRQGKIAALMGIEGGHAIEDSLRLLRTYYDLGIRYMTLTHSNTNNWADSSGDVNDSSVAHHDGLTSFGEDVVREMNRLGMMVDVSHVADATFWDVIEVASAPVIASHSSARALAAHPRNLTDEMIVALAETGGVVQVNFNCGFVSERFRQAQDAESAMIEAEFARQSAGRTLNSAETDALYAKVRMDTGATRASMDELIAHFDHIRDLVGVEAMGIGSDFNGVTCVPEGLEDVSQFPNLTRALLEHGYSPQDVQKIYSGNLLRVMGEVERIANEH